MKGPRRVLVPPLVSAAVLCLFAGAALAAPQTARPHTVHMDAVTLKITVTGSTVWGTVNAKYTFQQHTTTRSCSAASCRLHIPQGVTLHLSQTPADSATWPFQDWRVKSPQRTRTMSASSIKVKVTGTLSVKAIYVLAQSSSTGGYTP